jgi:hypothetical protein
MVGASDEMNASEAVVHGMELGSAGSTAAFPRMQERHRIRSRPGGRLDLVRSGTDSGRCRTSASDGRPRACVCNVEGRDVVAGDHDDVVLAGKAAVAPITNARRADLVQRSQSRAVVLVAAQPGRRQRGVLADEW